MSIRNERDVAELVNDIKRGLKPTLWCDGLW